MWFSYSDESTYKQDGVESADEFVEIIKQLSFKSNRQKKTKVTQRKELY